MALTPAITPAVQVWSDAQVNVGNVSTPEFPGPVSEPHSAAPLYEAPGSAYGPPSGHSATVSYFEYEPVFEAVPGKLGDTAAMYGHAAPQATFDSNAGNKYGNGPIADTHGFDTGGTERTTHVPMPRVGKWWRRTLTGQTFNRTVDYDPTGKIISTDNGRTDFDQYQGHNADAYDPYWIPYSERPIKLNIAHEPVPFSTDSTNVPVPGGQLGEVGPLYWTDQSNVYESPADPVANTNTQQQSQATATVGFWG